MELNIVDELAVLLIPENRSSTIDSERKRGEKISTSDVPHVDDRRESSALATKCSQSSRQLTAVWCRGYTLLGEPCGNRTTNSHGYCYAHVYQLNEDSSSEEEEDSEATVDEAAAVPPADCETLAAAVQCVGITNDNNRCRNPTKNSHGYCYAHVYQLPTGTAAVEDCRQRPASRSARASARASQAQPIASVVLPTAVKCNGITTRGYACEKTTKNAHGYCCQHLDQVPGGVPSTAKTSSYRRSRRR